jgi:membrane protein implicated in regulation of membrane protease activity
VIVGIVTRILLMMVFVWLFHIASLLLPMDLAGLLMAVITILLAILWWARDEKPGYKTNAQIQGEENE